ncbi:MAG: hypothetical protein ACT4RN_13615 [Pseudonocardia sp.]
MSTADPLGIYLNDHLAGANTGVEMARKLQDEVAGGPDEAVLGPVGDEIAADVETLRRLMARLDIGANPVKQATGWIAEKVHRLGVATNARHGRDLARMLAAESLSLGVEGKLGLWLVLIELAPGEPRLAEVDLAALAERARDQRRRIEAVRSAAARRAFAGG